MGSIYYIVVGKPPFKLLYTGKYDLVYTVCVSVDSISFVIYPELEATEVRFSALKRYFCSFYFRIDNETGGIHRNTLYTMASYRSHV